MNNSSLPQASTKFFSFENINYLLETSDVSKNAILNNIANTFEQNQQYAENLLKINDEQLNNLLSNHTSGGLSYSYPYILEIFGKSSMGKTQIMIQLLVSTLLTENISSANALYLSTEDSVKIIYRRFIQMFKIQFPSLSIEQEELLLNRINFLYSPNFINFVQYHLESILEKNNGIKYLFIDSISNDLRHINDNNLKNELFSKLTELSFKYKFMVVATNQVFTYINEDDELVNSKLGNASKMDDMRYGDQLIDCTKYETQIKHIANPLFHNRDSLGKDKDAYEKNHKFELPTLGYLFNNYVNTRLVLFHMGSSGDRFIRVLYSDSFDNSAFLGDPSTAQLKYSLVKNGLVKFKTEF